MILASIEECDESNNCEKTTVFTYDTNHYLPSRFSKAQDHWGYYNGQSSNTTLEPNHFVTWYDGFSNSVKTDEFGSANRTPDENYGKAGILKEVQYPTGGKTVFEYESHTAVNDEISGVLINETKGMYWQNTVETFTINSSSAANPLTKVKVTGFYNDPVTQCFPKIYIKNTTTNQVHHLFLTEEVLLENGTYEAWFVLESNVVSTCAQNDPASVVLNWLSESNSSTKVIGGLRIKSVTDYLDNNVLATKQNFNYNGDDGMTSGRVVNVPKYSRIWGDYYNSGTLIWKPISYKRYINTYIPLAATQGSDVGYGKITISHENEANGKEEQYYTTAEDYPDAYNGVNAANTALSYHNYGGVQFKSYPLPQTDSKDYLRGTLKKSVKYKKNGSAFSEVYEKLYLYDSLVYSKGDPPSVDNYVENAASTVRGIKVYESGGVIDYSYYNIYTGYNLPSKTIEKHYNDSGVLIQTSEANYDKDSYGIVNHYVPISNEITGSDGIVNRSETTYVFNKTAKTTAENDLLTNNALYLPLKTETFKNTTKLSSQYTIYDNQKWVGLNLPEYIQASKGISALENRIEYLDYDDIGNPLEVRKTKGSSIYYVWGYNKQYPIAKLENFTSTQAVAVQSLIAAAITASNNDNDRTVGVIGNEGALRTALTNLRNNSALQNGMVTTYTYDPLIGVTSITDSKGYTMYYEYDTFNRLEFVKDADGNLLSENKYNYKN